MRWLVTRRRHERELAAARAQTAEALRQAAEAETAARRTAGRNTHLTDQLDAAHRAADDGALDAVGRRLDRALRACAAYRQQLAEQGRLVHAQQKQLDELFGLDHPDLAAGARWADRRPDVGRRGAS